MRYIVLFLLLSLPALAIEKLPQDYLVCYGSEEAPTKIVQFYSFTCPHCIALFRRQFQQIKERYIEKGKIAWVFHPVPMDLLTVQAMDCLQKLSEREKKIFLEAVLEEIIIDNPKLSVTFLQKAMEVLGKPLPNLHEKTYLGETEAFHTAFRFLKEDTTIEVIPSLEVNGRFIEGKIPDLAYLENLTGDL